jgi:hypothetical protein
VTGGQPARCRAQTEISWDALGLKRKSIEIDHHCSEPRWIFARFPLNVAKALAESTPVQTSSTKARFSTC